MTMKESKLKELVEKKETVSMVIYGHIYKNCKVLESDNLFTKVEVNDIDERFIDHSLVLESKLVLKLPNIDFTLNTNSCIVDNYYQYWCLLEDFMNKPSNKNYEKKSHRNITQQNDPQDKINKNNVKIKKYKNDKKTFNEYLKNEYNKESLSKKYTDRFIDKLKNIKNIPEGIINELKNNDCIIAENIDSKDTYIMNLFSTILDEYKLSGWDKKNEYLLFKDNKSEQHKIPINLLENGNVKFIKPIDIPKKVYNKKDNSDDIKINDLNNKNKCIIFDDINEAFEFIFNNLYKEIDNDNNDSCKNCDYESCNNITDDEDDFNSILKAMEEFGRWIED